MIVVGKNIIDEYYKKHADVKGALEAWHGEAVRADWKTPQDIKNRYSTASILPGNVVIFDIKGNNYRLEVKVRYQNGLLQILWVGTHHEYDKRNKGRK